MPLSEAVKGSHIGVRTKAENCQNAPIANFDLYAISFICTNFEAFATISTIFTPVRRIDLTAKEFFGF